MPQVERPVCAGAGPGSLPDMFVWTKRSGERGKTRFYWWPLLLSLLLSVLLTLIVNAAIR